MCATKFLTFFFFSIIVSSFRFFVPFSFLGFFLLFFPFSFFSCPTHSPFQRCSPSVPVMVVLPSSRSVSTVVPPPPSSPTLPAWPERKAKRRRAKSTHKLDRENWKKYRKGMGISSFHHREKSKKQHIEKRG